MAVNGISGNVSPLPLLPGNRPATPLPAGSLRSVEVGAANQGGAAAPAQTEPLPPPAPTPPPTPSEADTLLENARQLNQFLRELAFSTELAPDNLLAILRSPQLTELLEREELDPIQQNALLINTMLQNLTGVRPVPRDPLAVGLLPPDLAAAEILDQLSLAQRTDLRRTEFLRELGPPLPGVDPPPAPAAPTAPSAPVTGQEVETAEGIPAIALTAVAPPPGGEEAISRTIAVAPPAPIVPPGEPVPIAARFLTRQPVPAPLPATLSPDRTPYVLAVYQINDPAPTPPPLPTGREVPLTLPAPPALSVGDERLGRLSRRGRPGGRRPFGERGGLPTIGEAEKSIRSALLQANEDLAAHQRPLHLVFTKDEEGFAIDVYDCFYNEVCRLSYRTPVNTSDISALLTNLGREAGVIIDRTS